MFIVDFRDLSSKSDVAKTLGCTPDTLAPIPRSFLAQHRIPKRSSGFREAWEVTSATHQETLKTLATRLEDFASRALSGFPRASVHGFVRGKSIVTNARVHAGARHLLRADIKDFFPTISRHRVARTFVDMGMTHDVASCLADFTTLDGRLPLGFCTSPLIANIVCHEMDGAFERLAYTHSANYTRYADDLAFSSDASLPARLDISSLEIDGFTLHPSKYSIKKRGQATFVTGLSVSDVLPHVPRRWKKRLSQEIYYAEKYGLYEHIGRANYSSLQSGINKISGRIQYLNSVEPKLAKKLQWRLERILETAGADFPSI